MIELKRKAQKPTERAEMPLKSVLPQVQGETPASDKPALKRQQMPFKSIDGQRDYKAMYADVFKFHEKYSPPDARDTGQPGGYWWTASEELTQLGAKYGNDAFITALLVAVYGELEREYQAIIEKQGGQCENGKQ